MTTRRRTYGLPHRRMAPAGYARSMRAGRAPARRGGKLRLVLALGIALFAIISYFGSKSYNPVTGESQYISITPHQEIAMGLQAAPQMIEQHGGLYPDQRLQDYFDEIGHRIVRNSAAADTGWQFDFHLLDDPETVNAFALPGGQCFMTSALYARLGSEGQVAGVLGHEIGHVVARHSAQRIAKSELTQGLTGAVIMGAGEGGQGAARVSQIVGQLVNMKYGREDELQSDRLGVRFMAEAGYDPRSLIQVMRVLAEASQGNRQPEFFSTHPNPENRVQEIERAIAEHFPNGVPGGLTP